MTQIVKPFSFSAPDANADKIIPTGLMFELENRLTAVLHLHGFMVVYGLAGAGKTTSARWTIGRINSAFDPGNPQAFRAAMYETARNSGEAAGKRALRTLYQELTGYPLDDGIYRKSDSEGIASEVQKVIARKRIGFIAIDEAGLMSVEAISALALLLDRCAAADYNLTIMLIGMDDLPLKMDARTRPQLFRRVHDWFNFKQYDLADTRELLAGLHPYFANLDPQRVEHAGQIEVVQEITGGLPGLIVQFLARFDTARRLIARHEVTPEFLRGIHAAALEEHARILATVTGAPSAPFKIKKQFNPTAAGK